MNKFYSIGWMIIFLIFELQVINVITLTWTRAYFSIFINLRDCGGASKWFMPFTIINYFVELLICFGSLSIWSLYPKGNFSLPNGITQSLKQSCTSILFIFPVKILKGVRPRRNMPPNRWILILCFGLPPLLPAALNNLLSLVQFLDVNCRNSTVQLNFQIYLCKSWQHIQKWTVCSDWLDTIWQYLVLIFRHPNLLTHPKIVLLKLSSLSFVLTFLLLKIIGSLPLFDLSSDTTLWNFNSICIKASLDTTKYL